LQKEVPMAVRFQVSVSLDGFLAGPDQSTEDPLGVRGEALHEWLIELDVWRRQQGETGGVTNASSQVVEEAQSNVGAYVMGRNMFGGGPGPWSDDPPWTGWWGDDPPYHAPVFVLTHHAREPLPMQGGTTFHFVTEGTDVALARAQESAGDADVMIGGGAEAIRQYLAAGQVDTFELHITPVILGAGERPLRDVGDLRLEQVRVIEAPGVTHVKYRVLR
jgi:dihydrofolate reductase